MLAPGPHGKDRNYFYVKANIDIPKVNGVFPRSQPTAP